MNAPFLLVFLFAVVAFVGWMLTIRTLRRTLARLADAERSGRHWFTEAEALRAMNRSLMRCGHVTESERAELERRERDEWPDVIEAEK